MKRNLDLLAIVCSFMIGLAVVGVFRARSMDSATINGDRAVGIETALVLLVDESCSWSNHPDLAPAWKQIVDRFGTLIPDSTRKLRLIGIGAATSPSIAYDLLRPFGVFDEITVGTRFNNGMLRYVDSDFRGRAAYPQVLVVTRELRYRSDGSVYRHDETVVQRLVGLDAINAFARRSSLGPGAAEMTLSH